MHRRTEGTDLIYFTMPWLIWRDSRVELSLATGSNVGYLRAAIQRYLRPVINEHSFHREFVVLFSLRVTRFRTTACHVESHATDGVLFVLEEPTHVNHRLWRAHDRTKIIHIGIFGQTSHSDAKNV